MRLRDATTSEHHTPVLPVGGPGDAAPCTPHTQAARPNTTNNATTHRYTGNVQRAHHHGCAMAAAGNLEPARPRTREGCSTTHPLSKCPLNSRLCSNPRRIGNELSWELDRKRHRHTAAECCRIDGTSRTLVPLDGQQALCRKELTDRAHRGRQVDAPATRPVHQKCTSP